MYQYLNHFFFTAYFGKLAIVDCRSTAGVWGNSFKGGGTEDESKWITSCLSIHFVLHRTCIYSKPYLSRQHWDNSETGGLVKLAA